MTNYKTLYQKTIKKSLLISLILIIFIFHLFPKFESQQHEQEIVYINILVQDIPITSQGVFRPPPPKPAVPIPSEDETIPFDETIEETDLNFDIVPLSMNGYHGIGSAIVPARPLTLAFPEYPEEDIKNKISGIVKLHVNVNKRGKVVEIVVLENTTNSKRCAKAAKKATYKCKYIPAKKGNNFVDSWTIRLVKFDIPK